MTADGVRPRAEVAFPAGRVRALPLTAHAAARTDRGAVDAREATLAADDAQGRVALDLAPVPAADLDGRRRLSVEVSVERTRASATIAPKRAWLDALGAAARATTRIDAAGELADRDVTRATVAHGLPGRAL